MVKRRSQSVIRTGVADDHVCNSMKSAERPKLVGTGLIALDWVVRRNTGSGIGAWTGEPCDNVLSILASLDWEAFPVTRLNGDDASKRIRNNVERWGPQRDWVGGSPSTDSAIIRQGVDGSPQLRSLWVCPGCGDSLPALRPMTLGSIDTTRPSPAGASVFFLNRLPLAMPQPATQEAPHGTRAPAHVALHPRLN